MPGTRATKASDQRVLVFFLILSFVPTWILWSMLWLLRVKPAETVRFAIFATAGMYFPAIAALVVRFAVLKEDLRDTTLLRPGRFRCYLWAWLLFPFLIITTVLLDVFSGAAHPDWAFDHLRMMFSAAGQPPPRDLMHFALGQLATAAIIGPPLHALTTIGEELGWRDFLLRHLVRMGFGQWMALIASGVVWGLWHIPVILLGLEYVEHPIIGVPMFVIYAILVGIIIGWLQLASGSVWVSALAHGSINAFQRAALVFIADYDSAIGGGLGSLVGWIPLSAFVVWLALSGRIPVIDQSGSEAGLKRQ
ncbi:MAG: lysostaphin resistance A-like protein [Candidatus Binataceae bacterium]